MHGAWISRESCAVVLGQQVQGTILVLGFKIALPTDLDDRMHLIATSRTTNSAKPYLQPGTPISLRSLSIHASAAVRH